MIKDDTWYVAITGFGGRYYSLVAAGSKSYGSFAEHFNQAGGSKIIAEQFDILPETIDKITGFDESGKKTKKDFLTDLVDRLNDGAELDVQEELSKLCAA